MNLLKIISFSRNIYICDFDKIRRILDEILICSKNNQPFSKIDKSAKIISFPETFMFVMFRQDSTQFESDIDMFEKVIYFSKIYDPTELIKFLDIYICDVSTRFDEILTRTKSMPANVLFRQYSTNIG